ncbi:MAG: hypothetical protein FWC76_00545 [Defluviitaleaceae bacterium]|nr:hypothetical protein [Defluviitaleaceae bacterium]
MKRYKAAAIIMIAHGLIEIGGFFSMLPIWLFGAQPAQAIPFDAPPPEIAIAGLIWGTIRLTGGVALFKNLFWGLALSVINCIIALAMMITLLPFGIMDGILASAALILMLTQYFGKKKIVE